MSDITNSMKEKGIISFFRSEYFVLITFISLITPMMIHTASLLLEVSNIKSTWYAYFFAFSFDLAIFAFSINGRKSQATGLAFIVFVLNVCFFNLDTFSDIIGYPSLVRLFVTSVISGAGSWIVHSYVVFFNEKIGERKELARLIKLSAEKDKRIHLLEHNMKSANQELEVLRREVKQNNRGNESVLVRERHGITMKSEEIAFPYTCTTCSQTALTRMAFDGLVNYCKNSYCRFKVSEFADAEELTVVGN